MEMGTTRSIQHASTLNIVIKATSVWKAEYLTGATKLLKEKKEIFGGTY